MGGTLQGVMTGDDIFPLLCLLKQHLGITFLFFVYSVAFHCFLSMFSLLKHVPAFL